MGEIVADSVFKYFGGIKNMKDGEWVVYKYDPTASDSFSLFNNYYITPNSGYFMAQSLLDSFRISYKYPENIRTRKLTENQMSLAGSTWKLISSPFLFDVEVDSNVPLYHYDVNTQNYKLTYIMKPYEGYFVEPSVSRIKMKTFDKYNPLIYPKALADIGWHLTLKVKDAESENELLFSMANEQNPGKKNSNVKKEYLQPVSLGSNFESFIIGEDKVSRCVATVKEGSEGAEWDFNLLSRNNNSEVKFLPGITGKLPKNFTYAIFNVANKKVVDENSAINISKGNEQQYKLLIGTKEYINEALNKLKDVGEITFALEQNYPNPFNPVTTIKYSLPVETLRATSPQNVTLKVFDILGKEVATLVNEQQQPGYYSVNFNASKLASGVYIYQLKAGSLITSKKMILLK
ncbi:MAG: T9SS C-terminal target domain-containing protein [Ignavibacteriales bacterium]|nr:MAG: T9SS C-terminal target domain-containing protein [Ignavibacteriales bacterium]